jgi:TRAP-type mannitol/chloroaromatic compound transport system permease small subunit
MQELCLRHNNNILEGEIAKIQQFLFSLVFILCHPYTTLPSLHLCWLASKQFALKQVLLIEISLN